MRFLRAFSSLAPALALIALAGCAGEYPQSSIDPRSDFAWIIQDLYAMITWITVAILVVVWALLAYVLVRFRERPDSPRPRQIHGHLGMEIAWTIVPAIIVVAIAIPTVQAVFATQRVPEDSYVIDVVGHQFWWEFSYPETGGPDGEGRVVTANEVHVPAGRPIVFRLSSDDVIHSFWVPMLGGKRDVNPKRAVPEGVDERYNYIHMTVLEPGVYMGQCAEFCGPSHSLMGLRVIAQEPEQFERWLVDWRAGDPDPIEADSTLPPAGPAVPDGGATDVAEAGQQVPAGFEPDDVEARFDEVDVTDLPEGLDPALVAQGREVFLNNTCVACHAIEGTTAMGEVGPNLTLLGRRSTLAAGWIDNSVENLVRWIAAPNDIKPGVQMPGVAQAGGNWPATGLTEEQVLAVAQYLYSLR